MEKQVEARCGNCACWVRQVPTGPVEIGAPGRGLCWAAPPTPFPKIDPRTGNVIAQFHLRPTPMENEQCALFTPHPGPAVVQ
jgi:hypothetical protein